MLEWRYSINYGPDGEENYAFVFDGAGNLVGNLKTHHARAVVDAMNRENRPPVVEQQVGGSRVKPLDLSTLLRDAFLAGRGLKDGDRLSGEDQAAWMAYDPERMAAYRRISTALYGRV